MISQVGEFDLRRLLVSGFVVTLLGLLLLQTIVLAATTDEREIAYDNGTPGGSVSLPYTPTTWAGGLQEKEERNVWIANQLLAVRFTSDNRTVQMLRRVRFYLTGDLASFNVYAFDSYRQFFTYLHGYFGPSPGSSYLSGVHSWTVTPASIGWNDLNVTELVNPIFISGDFYVAMEITVSERPRLGVDTTGPMSNRSWIVENQSEHGWIEYSAYATQNGLPDGNLMIRAVIGPLYTNTTTSTPSATPAWQVPTSIAFAISLVVAVGVWQVRKRRQNG